MVLRAGSATREGEPSHSGRCCVLRGRDGTLFRRMTCGLVIALTTLATAAASQVRTVTVAAQVTCADCRIVMQRVALLVEPASEPGLFGDSPTVSRDSRGNWYVVSGRPRSMVVVLDRTGTLIAKLGRQGQGPGEFTNISSVVVSPGDTIYVYQGVRRTVYSPRYTMIRTENVTLSFYRASLPDGRHVILGRVPENGNINHALHILAKNGTVARSLAPYSVTPGRTNSIPIRGIQIDASGLIWSARFSSYGIDVFDTSGVKQEEYVINSRWWNDPGHPGSEFRAAVPSAGDPNIVWLRSVFRDTSYTPPPRRPGDIAAVTAEQTESTFDTMFEAIDRRTGALLASARVPMATPSSSFTMLVPVTRVLDDGSTVIEIMEPRLDRLRASADPP